MATFSYGLGITLREKESAGAVEGMEIKFQERSRNVLN
jgi:hypothetical protein